MSDRWIDKVVRTGRLNVHADGSLRGARSRIFVRALSESNRLSRQHHLGVSLHASATAPAADERGVADVNVRAAGDRISFSYAGERIDEAFGGQGLHGKTTCLIGHRRIGFFKAFVFVPTEPQVNTPGGLRAVGSGVRLVVLVHACGLSNSDHSGSGDLFQAVPNVIAGDNAEGDRVELGRHGSNNQPLRMPPLVLGERAVQLIRSVWAQPASSPGSGSEQESPPRRGPIGSE